MMSREEMCARLDITDLYARYVHAVDKSDYATLEQRVFVTDTSFDMSDAGGPVLSWTQVKESDFMGGWGFQHFFHITSNLQIDFEDDGNSARTLSTTFNPWATVDAEGGHRLYHVHGRYHDKVVHTADGWRIASRRWENGWVSGWPAGEFRVLSDMTELSAGGSR
ncbi:nuclear transport factor 2 family protein [Streptomyces sp. NPDC048288]|uniref:nuclear transport factor 2 family protein n=1 Tax=Streptomyces sp. NPDC048288 TaxID=3365529 RepID=UPI00371A6BC5